MTSLRIIITYYALYNILYINKIVEQLFILFVTYKYKKKLPKPYKIYIKKK